MIDMAFQGLDPTLDEHRFSLHMAPVSPILEMERHEVVQMKLDRLERALRMGVDNQFDLAFWTPFVLRTYGGFPDEVVSAMYPGNDGAEGGDNSADSGGWGENVNGNGKRSKAPPDRRALEEAIVRTLGGNPDGAGQIEANTVGVMVEGFGGDDHPRSTGTITEWVGADSSQRRGMIAEGLQESLGPDTQIKPLSDGEARKFRNRIAESRSAVARGLLYNGQIMNLQSVGNYGR